MKNPADMRVFLPYAANHGTLKKRRHKRSRADVPERRGSAASLFQHRARRGAGRSRPAGRHARLRPDRGPLRPGAAGSRRPAAMARRESGRCGSSPPGRSPSTSSRSPPRISAGCSGPTPRCRRGAPRPRRAPSGSPSTRCCGCGRISPPRAAAPRSTAPGGRTGCRPRSCAIANFKGGVGKTSMAAHLAMSAALDGYRVLVIDLDSQGSMTSIFGGTVGSEWDTVFPLIARDYALGLQAENRRRAERGEAPLALEEMLAEALDRRAADVIQKTHWPNIDLIGAQLNLYWAEFQIPVWRMSLRGWKLWEALENALERDGVLAELRRRHPRYPPCPRLPDHQRAHRRRHPAGAARRLVPRVRFHGPVLRHAARDLLLDRGRREHSPRAPSAAPRSASNGTRCRRSSPATTPASRPSSPA